LIEEARNSFRLGVAIAERLEKSQPFQITGKVRLLSVIASPGQLAFQIAALTTPAEFCST